MAPRFCQQASWIRGGRVAICCRPPAGGPDLGRAPESSGWFAPVIRIRRRAPPSTRACTCPLRCSMMYAWSSHLWSSGTFVDLAQRRQDEARSWARGPFGGRCAMELKPTIVGFATQRFDERYALEPRWQRIALGPRALRSLESTEQQLHAMASWRSRSGRRDARETRQDDASVCARYLARSTSYVQTQRLLC